MLRDSTAFDNIISNVWFYFFKWKSFQMNLRIGETLFAFNIITVRIHTQSDFEKQASNLYDFLFLNESISKWSKRFPVIAHAPFFKTFKYISLGILIKSSKGKPK